MIRWVLLLLLWHSPAMAFDAKTKFAAVVVKDPGADFMQNPMIEKCFQSASLPKVSVPRIQVAIDPNSGQHMYTITFNGPSLSPRLTLENGQSVDLEKTSDRMGFVVTVLRPGANAFKSRFDIRNSQNEYVEYRMQVSPTSATFQEVLTDDQAKRVCIRSQAWVGLGLSALSYDQRVSGLDASSKFTALTLGSYHFDVRYHINPNWAVLASMKSAPGTIKTTGAAVLAETAFERKIYEAAAQYRHHDFMVRWSNHLIYPYVRFGLQSHAVPAIFIDDSGTPSLTAFSAQQIAAGVGVNVFDRSSMFYEAYINLKYPFVTSASSLAPQLHFDGALGAGRALTKDLSVGLYLHGHYDQFGYSLVQSGFENRGTTSLIFWNLDLKLGWTF